MNTTDACDTQTHTMCVLTTVGLVRVVPAVVHAVTLPPQAHTQPVGTLEVVGVTRLLKLRVSG